MKRSVLSAITISFWILNLAVGILLPPVFFAVFSTAGFAVLVFFIIRQHSSSVVDQAGSGSSTETIETGDSELPSSEIEEIDEAEPAALTSSVSEASVAEILQLLKELEAEVEASRNTHSPQLVRVRHITEDELRPRLGNLKKDTQQILQNVNRSYDISDNLSKTASNAFSLAAKVQKGIENINQSLQQSLQNTAFLEEQSKKISRILDLMSDISSQIQVLSMNASIVSARAGIHGKGFEVVAKEIRNLSHETENSLQEISSSIKEIQGTISTVSLDTQQADQAAAEETKSLMSVAGALQGVQLAVEVVHTVSTESKEKIQQQTDVLQQIEDMYNRLDDELRDMDSESSVTESTGNLVSRIRELLDGHVQ
ncbi:methyl-accepting chemotaxis protein [Spirochaeta dissipatitropha]